MTRFVSIGRTHDIRSTRAGRRRGRGGGQDGDHDSGERHHSAVSLSFTTLHWVWQSFQSVGPSVRPPLGQ